MREKQIKVWLEPLQNNDRDQFIKDNQYAFLYGATQEFGLRDNHFEEEGEIISRRTIEASIDGENAEAYRIMWNGEKAGGAVISIDKKNGKGELELLFVVPNMHSKGIGFAAWQAIEELHPEITVWETCTPYFEKRNIHFYVNRCGFHIVEFFNSYHPDPHDPDFSHEENAPNDEEFDGMFRFRKEI